jgi:very-short-patch-repair endonuclease
LNEIMAFLQSGRKLSFLNRRVLNPSWEKMIKSLKVNDAYPTSLEHFEAIYSVVEHRVRRHHLLSRWERQVSAIGGPSINSFGSEPEPLLEQLKQEIDHCLHWYNGNWIPLLTRFNQSGVQWEVFQNMRKPELKKYAELLHVKSLVENDLQRIMQAYINNGDWQHNQGRIVSLINLIQEHNNNDSIITAQLIDAIKELDIEKYNSVYEKIIFLWAKNEVIQLRVKLLSRIRQVAPDWAKNIQKRHEVHSASQPPSDMHKVWLLKQLESELTRRTNLQVDDLQAQLKKTRKEFQNITIQLVEKKAWLSLKSKTSLQQQSALNGWKLLMKKAGKRKGIRAPHLISEARKLMPMCQTAVPVWIMPISHVAENFDPSFNKFDIVIIDEASQADVMALTALYLGKQVVVVGDDEQVSPDAVGQKQVEVQKIIDTHLNGIPHAALYDGQTSIYDLAKTSFSGMTQLREHFRCVEPIIQFSNTLSYNGKILPLRDSSNVVTRPFTVEYRVEGELSGSKTNQIEARTVASLILAATEQIEYVDKTFGAISLVGEEQAVMIDQYLHKYLPATEYSKRSIRCGNSAQFQGDERDIMFLSMVHSPNGDGPLSRLADPGERMKKRYNVAASRARDQMWLVHSLDASSDLKDGDLRKRLIDHMKNPKATAEQLKQVESRIESEFEKQVIIRLLNEGYKVVPQWKVGAYRIDMVVEGGGKRLAIECDGDRFHPLEKIGEDMARQAILERLGWTFVRIRGGEFFRNPEKAMEQLFKKLELMEIPPQVQEKELEQESQEDELKRRVIHRAAEIRQEWEEQQDEYIFTVKKPRGTWNTKSKKTEENQTGNRERKGKEKEVKHEETPIDIGQKELNFTSEENPKHEEKMLSSLLKFLDENGLTYVDKRDRGGALWVIGDRSINRIMKDLANEGIVFSYLENGSKSTKKKPAWFTKSDI